MVGAWHLSHPSWEDIVPGILTGIFFAMFDFLWTGLRMFLPECKTSRPMPERS